MRLKAKFTESTGKFRANFGEIKEIKDGYSQAEVDKLVAEGIEQGKQAQYEAFWDSYQDNGKRTTYGGGFQQVGWNDATFKPKYDIVVGEWDNNLFSSSKITDLKGILEAQGVSLVTSKSTNGTSWFHGSTITRTPPIDASVMTSFASMFNYCSNLQEAELNNIRADATTNASMFADCRSLVTLKVTGVIAFKSFNLRWSPLLSNESVQSIIDCLKDLTGATAQTLTLHADVVAKMTDEQKAAITAKNWELVY